MEGKLETPVRTYEGWRRVVQVTDVMQMHRQRVQEQRGRHEVRRRLERELSEKAVAPFEAAFFGSGKKLSFK